VGDVRGWMFTSVEFGEGEAEQAFRQVCEKFDLCRHFAADCRAHGRPEWAA